MPTWSSGRIKDIQQDGEPLLKTVVVNEQSACPFEIAVISHAELTLAERDQRCDADCADLGCVGNCRHRSERVVFTVGFEQAVKAAHANQRISRRQPVSRVHYRGSSNWPRARASGDDQNEDDQQAL
jgi:hypothetical protein